MRVTKRAVDAAKYDDGGGDRDGADNARVVRWDTELPGFGVRVYPNSWTRSRV